MFPTDVYIFQILMILILFFRITHTQSQISYLNDPYYVFPGVALEDPKTEDLSQEVRGFIFSKILVRLV